MVCEWLAGDRRMRRWRLRSLPSRRSPFRSRIGIRDLPLPKCPSCGTVEWDSLNDPEEGQPDDGRGFPDPGHRRITRGRARPGHCRHTAGACRPCRFLSAYHWHSRVVLAWWAIISFAVTVAGVSLGHAHLTELGIAILAAALAGLAVGLPLAAR